MNNPGDEVLLNVLELRARLGLATTPAIYSGLKRSAQRGLIRIVTGPVGRPIGYYAWAELGADSVRRMVRTGALPPFAYEWDEGRFTILTDMVIKQASARDFLPQLAAFLAAARVFGFVRRARVTLYRRTPGRAAGWLRTRYHPKPRPAAQP